MPSWSPSAPVVATSVQRGATLGLDYGTSATWFVDASRPDDTGNGTSVGTAKKTIGAAVTLMKAAGGGTIAIRSGTYREKVDLSGAAYTTPVILQPYSTEIPVITGANVLTGWTACDSGDSTLLGDAWSNCYKTTISASLLTLYGNPTDFNLHEAGEPMGLCYDAAGTIDPVGPGNYNSFHTATSFGLSGGNIQTITHNSVMSQYTDAQLLNARVMPYYSPNLVNRFFDVQTRPTTASITITPTVAQNGSSTLYALFNILPAIQRGQWGINRTASGGNYTIYCWPTNAANLTGNIEASVRDHVIYTGSSTGSITIRGLTLYQSTGGGGDNGGSVIATLSDNVLAPASRRGPLTITNCRIGKNWANTTENYGILRIANTDDVTITNNYFLNAGHTFGMTLTGTDDIQIERNIFYRMGRGSINLLAGGGSSDKLTQRVTVAHNYCELTGIEAHSNLMNFYQQVKHVLVYGNRFYNCRGYLTWQNASEFFIAFNDIILDPSLYGGELNQIIDQNTGSLEPTNGVTYLWNNRMTPIWTDSTAGNYSMLLGEPSSAQQYAFYNNIIHGGGVYLSEPQNLVEEKTNLYTKYSSGQNAGNTDASDIYDAVMANTYLNYASGDFRYTPGGKAGKPGTKPTAALAAAAAIFTAFNFERDMYGRSIDWNMPFIGPYNPGFRS